MIEAATENQATGSGARQVPAWLTGFVPSRGLSNGHLQTIVGNYMPAPPIEAPVEAEEVVVDASDNSRVLCHAHFHADAGNRLTLVLVHGLEGSSDSRYILRLTRRGWQAGANVVRMNMRNCGGTDTLTPTLYHSGLSGDVGAVIEHFTRKHGLEQVALVGYSMGGNLVLRLAGEWGRRAPLMAVATVCPVIDLAAGSDALHEPVNRPYEQKFLGGLMKRFRLKAALYPDLYDTRTGPIRSLRAFDDRIVARYYGFRDADDYYYRAAAARVIDRVAVPTLILCAGDDPFIRITAETRAKIRANPAIRFVETRHGGHCAYLGREQGAERHWAEAAVIRWLTETVGRTGSAGKHQAAAARNE